MAGEEDLINFLKTRNIPDNVAEKLKEDKIDINVINVMTDEELGQYIVKYGDRLAVKAFCQQRSETFQTAGVKSALMQRVRQKLTERRYVESGRPRRFGNQHAAKDNRRVEMGWLHFINGDFHQVRTRHGGGTRHLSVQKNITMGELLEMGKALFFPNGQSPKGSAEDFVFDIRDFSHENVPLESTVNQLYEQTKIKMLRIYTCSRGKEKIPTDDQFSDMSSDFEDTEDMQRKTRRIQRQCARKRTRRYERSTNDQMNNPGKSTESDVIPNFSTSEEDGEADKSSKQSQSPSLEIIHKEMLDSSFEAAGTHPHEGADNPEAEDDCFILSHNQDADEVLQFTPVVAINASAEDFEIQFGPVSNHDEESLDSTLLWNQDDINSSQHSTLNDGAASLHSIFAQPGQNDKEIHCVQIRRINVVSDLINIFMEPAVMNVQLKMELTNEKAFDSDGVSREVYSAFWERFLELCEGEDERVPRLRPDFTEKHWEAVGRIWLKGYLDHNIIPIQLSPAFILACFQGVSSVDEELLMMCFHRFISAHERLTVDKALQGNLDEDVEEDLLDLFSRMGSHNLPTKENVQASLSTIAHKVLVQEPKFVIDSFHSCFCNAVPSLASKENIIELYESKRATNKKVAQMIKPSNESLNSQEQTALNHLLRYVRSIDQKKLETFLRFCTGSTVLCKDTIEITFNRLSGLNRRVVAHTCGAVLELPCTYVSYPEFRTELDNILAGDCFTMDIL